MVYRYTLKCEYCTDYFYLGISESKKSCLKKVFSNTKAQLIRIPVA